MDINNIEIEDDMSLGALEVIKNRLMGKMGLNEKLEPVNTEDVEDGEVLDSDEEGPQEKAKEKKVDIEDLRRKLNEVERTQRDKAEKKSTSPLKK